MVKYYEKVAEISVCREKEKEKGMGPLLQQEIRQTSDQLNGIKGHSATTSRI